MNTALQRFYYLYYTLERQNYREQWTVTTLSTRSCQGRINRGNHIHKYPCAGLKRNSHVFPGDTTRQTALTTKEQPNLGYTLWKATCIERVVEGITSTKGFAHELPAHSGSWSTGQRSMRTKAFASTTSSLALWPSRRSAVKSKPMVHSKRKQLTFALGL